MADDLKVQKREEQVGLFFADGQFLEARIFLAEYSMHRSGEQTLLDLLLEEEPFLPAKTEDGEFHLVRKGMVSHIRCQFELDPRFEYIERKVKISFFGGAVLVGMIKMDMPSYHARLTDYINGGVEFFPLFTDSDSYLVNRDQVRDLVLFD